VSVPFELPAALRPGAGVRRLASRLGITEGQAYTVAIGLVLGLGTAAIGIPPTLRDRPAPEAAAPASATPAPEAPTAPAAVPTVPAAPSVAPVAAAPFAPPLVGSYADSTSAPVEAGPSFADGGALGDVAALATTSGPPAGVAVDPATGAFYVAQLDRVVRYAPSGAAERSYPIPGGARLTGVDLEGDHLVVLDSPNGRVLEVDVTSGAVRTVATVPELEQCTNPTATDCELARGGRAIEDVVSDGAGTRYLSDAGQGIVWRLTADGRATPWLRAPELLSTDGHGPSGLAIDPTGQLYVAVSRSVVALTGAVYRVAIGADGSPGRPEEVFRSQPNTSLAGLAVGSSGRLYVTSPSDRTLLVVEGGTVVRSITSPLLAGPYGLAFRGRSLLVTNITGGNPVRGSVVRASAEDAA